MGDGVWWGKDGKYEKMSEGWVPWKQQTRVRIQKLGMSGRGKARFLTAVAFVMPVIGAAVSVTATCAVVVLTAGGAVDEQPTTERAHRTVPTVKRMPEE